MTDHIHHEPAPEGDGQVVLPAVIKDLEDRAEIGRAKYGTFLRTNNGRRALVDAYQEGLDLVMYLKQKLLEDDEETRLLLSFHRRALAALAAEWLSKSIDDGGCLVGTAEDLREFLLTTEITKEPV